MKKVWNHLVLLSLSLICTIFFSGCGTVKILGAASMMKGSWKPVEENDQSSLSAYSYVCLNTNEHAMFRKYIEKNGFPEYINITDENRMCLVYVEKELRCNYSAQNGSEDFNVATFQDLFRHGLSGYGGNITEIPAVVEHYNKMVKAQQEAEEAKRQKWEAEREAEQAARDKARQEQRIETEKRDAIERQARQKEEAKEEADKKAEEAKIAAHIEQLKANPELMFKENVQDKFAIYKGKLFAYEYRVGKVMQVLDKKRILLDCGVIFGKSYIYSVILNSTEELVDDAQVRLKVIKTGTYHYTAITGAGKTIEEYTALPSVTYAEFLELWNAKKLNIDKLLHPDFGDDASN